VSARTFDPRLSPGENMSRMKLGLFGAARPTDGRLIVNEADPIVADGTDPCRNRSRRSDVADQRGDTHRSMIHRDGRDEPGRHRHPPIL
jgi:hypothetical protein